MMKINWLLAMILCSVLTATAQRTPEKESEEGKHGFQKDRLFTGGSLSVAFYTGGFSGGLNPVFGYSFTKWLDGGIVINYNLVSQKGEVGDKLRQTTFGGGLFTRIYPVRFLFVQGGIEQNFITQKYDGNGYYADETIRVDAPSTLVGGGYTTGRNPDGGAFFYVSVLWDISRKEYSPYVDASGRATPIIRAGVQIPLFQGRSDR